MTPHARNTSILVSLVLLSVATFAHAECAWMMWNTAEMLPPPTHKGWRFVSAFGSRNDCVRELARRAANWKEGGWRVIADEDDVTAWDKDTGMLRLRCLPESIDPRGVWARLTGWLTGW